MHSRTTQRKSQKNESPFPREQTFTRGQMLEAGSISQGAKRSYPAREETTCSGQKYRSFQHRHFKNPQKKKKKKNGASTVVLWAKCCFWFLSLPLQSSFLPMHLGKPMEDGPSVCIPATHLAEPEETPGFGTAQPCLSPSSGERSVGGEHGLSNPPPLYLF